MFCCFLAAGISQCQSDRDRSQEIDMRHTGAWWYEQWRELICGEISRVSLTIPASSQYTQGKDFVTAGWHEAAHLNRPVHVRQSNRPRAHSARDAPPARSTQSRAHSSEATVQILGTAPVHFYPLAFPSRSFLSSRIPILSLGFLSRARDRRFRGDSCSSSCRRRRPPRRTEQRWGLYQRFSGVLPFRGSHDDHFADLFDSTRIEDFRGGGDESRGGWSKCERGTSGSGAVARASPADLVLGAPLLLLVGWGIFATACWRARRTAPGAPARQGRRWVQSRSTPFPVDSRSPAPLLICFMNVFLPCGRNLFAFLG
jgi:hypothetical protein